MPGLKGRLCQPRGLPAQGNPLGLIRRRLPAL